MKGGDEGVKVESFYVMNTKMKDKKKNKKKKKKKSDDQGFGGCWNKWGFIGSCVSSRSKVDSSTSGISSQLETKSTTNASKDQPETAIVAATSTSNCENNNLVLYKRLFVVGSLPLPWSIRMKIALGAAKGLAFLHEEAKRPVIYRDFKTSNILLDAEYNAKLSDFGLAKDGPEGDKTHISTRVMGTYGYAAPEYVMTGHLSSKSDVYSFGVVLLEMLTGRRSMDKKRPNGEHNLVEWARPHLGERRRFYRLIDPRLEGNFSIKGAQKAAQLAARCLSRDPKARPLMSEVVECLEPLPALKDMAGSSYYLQIGQPERVGSSPDQTRTVAGSFSRNGQQHPRTLSIPNASPRHHQFVQISPKLKGKQ
ncbi:hypothetical protein M8C21_012262 [Ambrosia artemisiifolia]|uniref:Protein kinase domain-containing protein n=1 Tax=Ambrosia artemisiifolia TaxID=4212 RepID=A0AAD5CBH6_AMBAR|nr:hypothetical protein M8C21_012262 [Ambrosia artemisiifolia]